VPLKKTGGSHLKISTLLGLLADLQPLKNMPGGDLNLTHLTLEVRQGPEQDSTADTTQSTSQTAPFLSRPLNYPSHFKSFKFRLSSLPQSFLYLYLYFYLAFLVVPFLPFSSKRLYFHYSCFSSLNPNLILAAS
jgi:hypothetical protein